MSKLYAIRDSKAICYSPPFVARSDSEAMRIVIQSLQPDSQLSQFPDDFSLYCIGVWDEEVGLVEGVSPKFVAYVTSLMPGGSLNAKPALRRESPWMDEAAAPLSGGSLNGEADAVGDGAPVQSGAECDDPEERI